MKFMKSWGLFFLALVCGACSVEQKMETVTEAFPQRPSFHFTPEKNWTNDPNGLVYLDGEYHLFYQNNPYGKTWGHMSWGHAVSEDLIHWQHLPVALEEYVDGVTKDSTMIFSGTVVVDENDTGGFGKNALVAIYTSHVHKGGAGLAQHQSMAYSVDKGRTWKRYDKNPIVDIGRKDFRDPKVFWYEPEKKWVMVLVVPDLFKVQFYESKNLKEWKLSGEFGGAGDTLRIWECPDLYPLTVENEKEKTKWVLSLSGSHPAGSKFVGMQYFVGEFDGKKFVADDKRALYVNDGKDFYAGIVYNHLPKEQNRTVMIGWTNNWTYANQIPAGEWRGAMTIPRVLSLLKTEGGYRLLQRPVSELTSLRGKEIEVLKDLEKKFELEVELSANEVAGVRIGNDSTNFVEVGYDFTHQEIFLDRRHAGVVDFQPDFASVEVAKFNATEKVKLKIYFDGYILEIFSEDGLAAITDLTFLKGKVNVVSYAIGGEAKVRAWEVK